MKEADSRNLSRIADAIETIAKVLVETSEKHVKGLDGPAKRVVDAVKPPAK